MQCSDERKDDNNRLNVVSCGKLKELDRENARRIPVKDVKDDMESLGLSEKDAQFRNKWRRRIKGGNQPTQAHLEKWWLQLLLLLTMY